MAKTYRDIEGIAKQELLEEAIEKKKVMLKSRIQEVRSARKILAELEEEYQSLLNESIEDD